MTDSIFTQIIERKIPATIQYEDENFIAFNDIHPRAPIHVLIVPKQPYESLEKISLDDDQFHAQLLVTIRKVAQRLNITANYKIFMNVGKRVQDVQHLHVHLLGGWDFKKEVPPKDLVF